MINFFYLLIAVLPLESHWFWRMELLPSFTVMKLLGMVCLVCALGKIISGNFNTQLLRTSPARWFLVFACILSTSYFLHGGDLKVDGSVYSNILSILALFVATLVFVDSRRRLRQTLLLAIGGAAFASLYTIRGQQMAPTLGGSRPSGIFEDANYYALVIGLWIPLAFLWSFSRQQRMWERAFCLTCLASMLLGTTFAASRGGSLGLAAALGFMVWHSRHRLRNFVIIVGVMGPLLVYAPSSPLHRFQNPGYGDQRATEARVIAWTAGLRMIQAHPLNGVGLGNFRPLVASYEDPGANVVTIAHNTYLETAAELGLPALVIHLGVLVTSFVTLGRVRRRALAVRSWQLYQFALALQAGLISYAISAVFVSSWWQKMPWLLVYFAMCLPVLSTTIGRRKKPIAPRALAHGSNDPEKTAYVGCVSPSPVSERTCPSNWSTLRLRASQYGSH